MSGSRGRWTPDGLCSLFVCDIASFGHPARSDLDRHTVRRALYDGLRSSFDDEGVPLADCYREDRGDGAMVLVPPSTDTAILLTSLVDRLKSEVRRHNDVSSTTARMRLRVAVHTGVVRSDANGLIGTAVNHVFRLLEAEALRLSLQRTGADIALIASDRVYEDVIWHGLGLVDPGEYQGVPVRVKETVTTAWIRVPGMRPPFVPDRGASPTVLDAPVVPAQRLTAPDPDAPRLPPAKSAPPRGRPALPRGPSNPPPAVSSSMPPPSAAPPSAGRPAAGQGPPRVEPPRSPAPTVIEAPRDLDHVLDLAMTVRQLRGRHLRDQIVAELPLALASAIRTQRHDDDRADMLAILRICRRHRRGLDELLRVLRRFAGDCAEVDAFGRSIDALGQT